MSPGSEMKLNKYTSFCPIEDVFVSLSFGLEVMSEIIVPLSKGA